MAFSDAIDGVDDLANSPSSHIFMTIIGDVVFGNGRRGKVRRLVKEKLLSVDRGPPISAGDDSAEL
jgi:hypothetical protein